MDFTKMMQEVGMIGTHFVKMMPEILIKALTNFPVLVTGETGTGKELVASLIHKMSNRSDKPLQFINMPAIHNGVFESELFGHEKGSFTDASDFRKGLILTNDGGTIVLDEIGDMPLEVQAKILRWLENSEIKSVGSDRSTTVDVRIIASTNKNLTALVEMGLFRKDLYYRLNTLSIDIPPLRQNPNAILDLAKYFVDKNTKHFSSFFGTSSNTPHGSELAKLFNELIEANKHCPNFLSGNARELESIVKEWLFEQVHQNSIRKEKEVSYKLSRHKNTCLDELTVAKDVSDRDSKKEAMRNQDIVVNIYRALFLCNGDTNNASILLECSEDDLLKMMSKYNISTQKDDFVIRRNSVIPIESLLNNETVTSWVNEISCNFSNPSNTELEMIKKLLTARIAKTEHTIIQSSLNHFKGDLTQTREILQISEDRLQKKMKEHSINSTSSEQSKKVIPISLKEAVEQVRNELVEFLIKNDMSAQNISEIFEWHINTVYTRIRRYGLK